MYNNMLGYIQPVIHVNVKFIEIVYTVYYLSGTHVCSCQLHSEVTQPFITSYHNGTVW